MKRERVIGLDVLKGLGVLGMAVTHLWLLGVGVDDLAQLGGFGRGFFLLGDVLVHGKFTVVFSALFGVGLAFQLERDRGFHLNRAGLLLGVGFLQALVFPWEILGIYALGSLLVLAMRRASSSTIVATAGALVAASIGTAFWIEGPGTLHEGIVALGGLASDPLAFITANVWIWGTRFVSGPTLYVLGSILLGFAFGRAGLYRPAGLERLTDVRAWAGLVAIGAGLAYVAAWVAGSLEVRSIVHPLFSIAGGWWIILAGLEFFRRDVLGLAAVGRNSLSNYVVQNVLICGAVFGTGSAGSMPPAVIASIVVLLWTMQLVGTRVVVERWGAGPLELAFRWMLAPASRTRAG